MVWGFRWPLFLTFVIVNLRFTRKKNQVSVFLRLTVTKSCLCICKISKLVKWVITFFFRQCDFWLTYVDFVCQSLVINYQEIAFTILKALFLLEGNFENIVLLHIDGNYPATTKSVRNQFCKIFVWFRVTFNTFVYYQEKKVLSTVIRHISKVINVLEQIAMNM